MNCHSCLHVRKACNRDLVGCFYWTAIFHGNKPTLRSALIHINKRENFGINMDSPILEKEAVEFLIDILIEEYAPKPMYEGWVDLKNTRHQKEEQTAISDSCVVLEPTGCCDFYICQVKDKKAFQEERATISYK